MPRVKCSVSSRNRRKKVLNAAKGYRGGRSKLLRTANETIDRAGVYAYRDRKAKKRSMRNLWIVRINAAARGCGITYSRLIEGLAKAEVALDRKALSELAINDPAAFKKVAEIARETLAA